MNEWIEELSNLVVAEPVVIVTVAGTRGSAPREVGAKMIVTQTNTIGTIGGGQLEYQCTRIAFGMLGEDNGPRLRKFPLGSSMGQCCGGVVDILFEPMTMGSAHWLQDLRALHGQREPAVLMTHLGINYKGVLTADNVFAVESDLLNDALLATAREALACGRASHDDDWFLEPVVGSNLNIAVFGAGHVGSAVVRALAALDCNIRWIDNRRHIFPQTPANVREIESPDPSLEAAAMPARSCFLVMTHSHALDFEICHRVLQRGDATYCGLIGSVSKRRRFERRFRAAGLRDDVLSGLVCPIGVTGISGKKPAEIAVAVSAEVLQAHEAREHSEAYPDNVHAVANVK